MPQIFVGVWTPAAARADPLPSRKKCSGDQEMFLLPVTGLRLSTCRSSAKDLRRGRLLSSELDVGTSSSASRYFIHMQVSHNRSPALPSDPPDPELTSVCLLSGGASGRRRLHQEGRPRRGHVRARACPPRAFRRASHLSDRCRR